MEAFLKDLRQSFRILRVNPAFTLAAIAALTLGIGANTAIFSIVNAVMLRPVAAPDADRLVIFQNTSPQGSGSAASPAKFLHYRAQTDIVTDAAGDTVAFNQLGGRAAVEAVVDEFIAVVGADSRINGFFATSDLDALNGLLVEQICEATGGYCTYSGRSMCETHDGMGVSESDFDALVGDLLAALDTLGVPYALDGSAVIDPLLLALVGMEGEIVDPQVDCP